MTIIDVHDRTRDLLEVDGYSTSSDLSEFPSSLLGRSLVDRYRPIRTDVLLTLQELAKADQSALGRHLEVALAELDRRRRSGFGLSWDAESPDNAERLHVRVKDGGDETSCGIALTNGVVVDFVDDDESLYRLVDTTPTGNLRFQPWEPLNGDLPVPEVVVPRSEVSHVVHMPVDRSTTVYPVLKHVETIRSSSCPDTAPAHTLIEGENFHALQALLATHREQVDVIYIDPPYNTGSQDFAYNDRFVDATDNYRHSRWLRFMERRLRLARELLRPEGVIIVAIGDDEHHRLRLLLDQVFGVKNYLSDITWQGRVKNDKRFTGGGADYMLAFAKDQTALVEAGVRWSERKPGVSELLAVARNAFESSLAAGKSKEDAATSATTELRKWATAHKGEYSGGLLSYRTVDESGAVYQAGPLDSPNPRPNLTYAVLHPATGKPIPTPRNGWRVSKDVLAEMQTNGLVLWGKDHTVGIRRKLVLTEESEGVPAPSFTADRDTATKHLRNMIGDSGFSNPKPHEVIMRWLRIAAPTNAVVLDFFAGSGSTLHAVAEMNAADKGTRTCILVTNNSAELRKKFVPDGGVSGICRLVTAPRVRAVLETGYGKTSAILQRCEWFRLDYLHGQSLRNADGDATSAILPTLWLDAGLSHRIGDRETNGIYVHGDLSFAVLPASVPFGDFRRTLNGRVPRTVWVVGEPGSKPAMIREFLPGSIVRLQTGSYKDIIDGTLRGAV